VIPIATSSWRSVTQPAAVTRVGPWRSGVSAPRGSRTGRCRSWRALGAAARTTQAPIAVSARNDAPVASAARGPRDARRGRRQGVGNAPRGPRRGARRAGCRRNGRRHGAPRVLAVIGGTLVEERLRSLVRLVRRVVQPRRVAGELLEPGEAIGRDQERRLEEPDRGRAHVQDLVRPLHALGLQVRQRHDLVDEVHRQRVVGAVLAAQEPDSLALLVATGAPAADPEAA